MNDFGHAWLVRLRRMLFPPFCHTRPEWTERPLVQAGCDPYAVASCRFCRAPLWYWAHGYGQGFVVALRCNSMRDRRCAKAALLVHQFGTWT